jgi:hypothetical protein
MSCNHSFIFDRPITCICKTVKYMTNLSLYFALIPTNLVGRSLIGGLAWGHVWVHIINPPISDRPTKFVGIKAKYKLRLVIYLTVLHIHVIGRSKMKWVDNMNPDVTPCEMSSDVSV